MNLSRIDQQEHAYRSGHQLIANSRRLPSSDQDIVDRLSDMAGQLRPGEVFAPYLTAYPLPSGSDYVLARTWQDLEAPRSGCVRTRSLLIPMKMWTAMDGVGGLLPLLVPVRASERLAALAPAPLAQEAEPISDPRKVELVEALFLEARQPIVVFEASEAEAMIQRILSALWPGLRRAFAACSFTLAPRTIDGRDFDLQFAPKSARSRFANWGGRRIEAVSAKVGRHRWSAQIVRQVFESNEPSLLMGDRLGALRSDPEADESSLRVSLLWNELAAKAATTPSAVLGMMDILNSRVGAFVDYSHLPDLINNAAALAISGPDELEAWQFLSALFTKVANVSGEWSNLIDIRNVACELASRAPMKALQFAQSEFSSERFIGRPILAGIADGVAEKSLAETGSDLALHLPADLSASFMSQSGKYASAVFGLCNLKPDEWIPAIVRALRLVDQHDRVRLLMLAAPSMTSKKLVPLLEPMLDEISSHDLIEFVVELGKSTAYKISAFDQPIVSAVKDTQELHALRGSILSRFEGAHADRFLLSTLELSSADIRWLCFEVTDRGRAVHLLRHLIDDASDRDIVTVLRDVNNTDQLFDLLLSDIRQSMAELLRLVAAVELPIN